MLDEQVYEWNDMDWSAYQAELVKAIRETERAIWFATIQYGGYMPLPPGLTRDDVGRRWVELEEGKARLIKRLKSPALRRYFAKGIAGLAACAALIEPLIRLV